MREAIAAELRQTCARLAPELRQNCARIARSPASSGRWHGSRSERRSRGGRRCGASTAEGGNGGTGREGEGGERARDGRGRGEGGAREREGAGREGERRGSRLVLRRRLAPSRALVHRHAVVTPLLEHHARGRRCSGTGRGGERDGGGGARGGSGGGGGSGGACAHRRTTDSSTRPRTTAAARPSRLRWCYTCCPSRWSPSRCCRWRGC